MGLVRRLLGSGKPEQETEWEWKTVERTDTIGVYDWMVELTNGEQETHQGTNLYEIELDDPGAKVVIAEEKSRDSHAWAYKPDLVELRNDPGTDVVAWWYLHDVRTYEREKVGEKELEWKQKKKVKVENDD